MITPNEIDQQIIFYCKNWFLQTDLVEDIKKIMGYYYDVDPEYYSEREVLDRVFKTAFKCAPAEHFQERIINLFDRNENVSRSDMIKDLCGLLCGLKIFSTEETLIKLDEPNYEVLPKAERKSL